MPSIRIPKDLKSGFYYLAFTIRNWYYILDRHNRFRILADSLNFCRAEKELKIYAYVFMINHIHLIASSPDMIGFVRDFKKFTSKELLKNIRETEPPVLKLFDNDDGSFEVWARTNMPKQIESEGYLIQKMNYIHENPVRRQYVMRPEYCQPGEGNCFGSS